MEAVGQLIGGIAHDFNNLLTTILGNLELLGARLAGGDEPSARLLAAVRTAAERGARLTTKLLAFSRQQRMTPKPVELNRIITGMWSRATRQHRFMMIEAPAGSRRGTGSASFSRQAARLAKRSGAAQEPGW
jgi:signal transduction histidine kinase